MVGQELAKLQGPRSYQPSKGLLFGYVDHARLTRLTHIVQWRYSTSLRSPELLEQLYNWSHFDSDGLLTI